MPPVLINDRIHLNAKRLIINQIKILFELVMRTIKEINNNQ